ncbi:hypothetical protein [Rhizobium mesoamericanum]|nr:hypothetical protein [Rhizobium mesoamericanum]
MTVAKAGRPGSIAGSASSDEENLCARQGLKRITVDGDHPFPLVTR